MIKFGPAGNSNEFYNLGYKKTIEAMKWVSELGLNAFEYQCGRGVLIKEDTAMAIGNEAKKYEVSLSVHAPYFINFAGKDEEKLEKSFNHLYKAIEAAQWMGASRVCVHPGTLNKDTRENAYARLLTNFKKACELMVDDIIICPELMGKINQLGNLKEIIQISNLDERVIPTIDFGHLNARTFGGLNSKEAFEEVIVKLINGMGINKVRQLHVHFSKIEFTLKGGEKKHLTFEDDEYGPDFKFMIPSIIKYNLQPTIICESRGTQARDAKEMKEMLENARNGN